MRTRSRDLSSGIYSDSGIFLTAPFETISDDVSFPHGNKPCDHRRTRVLACGGSILYSRDGGQTWSPYYDGDTAMISAYNSAYCNKAPKWGTGVAESEASSKALQGFATAVREGGRSDFHAISFLREISDTYRMVKNPFNLMTALKGVIGNNHRGSSIKKLLRKHKKKVASRLKGTDLVKSITDHAGNVELELVYGWQPFVSDCKAIFGGVSKAVESRRKALKAKTPHRFRIHGTGTDSVSWPNGSGGWQYLSNGKISINAGATVSAWGVVNPTLQSESAVASLLRATNIDRLGYAAWDAVPYSFVVDWFLPNLGAKLDEAISGPAFYTTVTQPYIGLKTKVTASVGVSGNRRPTTITFSGGGSFSCETLIFTRKKCDVGSLSVTDFEQGMQGTRIASGLALAWGRMRS